MFETGSVRLAETQLFFLRLMARCLAVCQLIWVPQTSVKLANCKLIFVKKKVREKSRECHSHKLQPFPDTKKKRKQTKPNKCKSNSRSTICRQLPDTVSNPQIVIQPMKKQLADEKKQSKWGTNLGDYHWTVTQTAYHTVRHWSIWAL